MPTIPRPGFRWGPEQHSIRVVRFRRCADHRHGGGNENRGSGDGYGGFYRRQLGAGHGQVSGNGNQATWPPDSSPYSVFAVGAHSVTAKYSGDASYNASTSPAVAFTVVKGATRHDGGGRQPSERRKLYLRQCHHHNSLQFRGRAYGHGDDDSQRRDLRHHYRSAFRHQYFRDDDPLSAHGHGPDFRRNLAPGNNVVTLTYSGDGNYASTTTTVTIYNTSGVGSFAMSNSGNLTLTAGQSANETITITRQADSSAASS